jgi:hypothetical protein
MKAPGPLVMERPMELGSELYTIPILSNKILRRVKGVIKSYELAIICQPNHEEDVEMSLYREFTIPSTDS